MTIKSIVKNMNLTEEETLFFNKTFGVTYKIKEILKKQKITKAEFARRCGVSRAQITKWLSGDRNFTLKTITKMEYALKTQIIKVKY